MADNKFEFIGRLAIGKESEKFKPYEQKTTNGWTNTRLVFNVIAGDNRHMLEIKGLHKEDGAGTVYTFDKGGINKDTQKKVKPQKLKVAWEDRNKQEIIDQVAEFMKFIIDYEEPKRRYLLEKAVEKFNEGTLTDEELAQLEITDPVAALEESKKKRKEFIHETDFIPYVKKLIESGKFADRLFKVTGDIQYTHSEKNGKFYKHLAPSRIYLAEKDAKPSSIGNLVLFFKKDCIEEAGKRKFVKGYIRNYDNQRKEDISIPITLTIDLSKDDTDEKKAKLHNLLISQFTLKDKGYKELGLKVNMLNGSQKMEITQDMLNDFQKEMLELEAISMDDIIKELGGDVYGKPVEEMVIENVSKGYSKGRKDTLYQDSHFIVKPLEIKEKDNKKEDAQEKKDEDDIFGDFMD